MHDWLASLRAGVAPELVWGVVPRLVGALFFVAFASLSRQILGLSGSAGISPAREQLAAMRAHYPGPARFVRMPTLLWIDASDTTLRALPWLGMAAASFVVYGGPGSHVALFICYALYLSLDVASLMFPWDCLLFEAGVLTLFLPEGRALPDLHASSLPLPLAAFAFQFLIIRLMWGFAKLKFIGTKRGDNLFLRGFLAWMPMCTPLGFAMQHAPAWFLRASYAFMWFAEVICPGLAFFRGELRLIGALGLMGLMAGIWATGNWGFFNVGYGALCFALFDTQSSLLDMTWAQVTASPGAIVLHTLLGLHLLSALLFFPANSWGTHAATFLPFDQWSYTRPWLRALIAFYRSLAPFRLFHAYGVFPANSSPPIKVIPVFEGSLDGVEYRPYRYRYMPCLPDSRAPIVAPHHPRLDHLTVYAGSGLSESDYLSSLMGAGKPYGFGTFSHYSWLHRTAQRLLEGSAPVRALFGSDPFAGQPPRYCRVSLHALTPAGLRDAYRSGDRWRMRRCGTLLAAREKNANVYKHWLTPPELFHPDNLHYRRVSPALSAMLRAHDGGAPIRESVRVASDITPDEVARFWDELVPLVAQDRTDFARVDELAREARARFGEEGVLRMERIAERYVHLLRTKLEPYFYGHEQPQIRSPEKCWSMTFHLLMHERILDGEQAYREVLQRPALAAERCAHSTPESQLRFIAVVRNETVRYHGRSLRIARRLTNVFEEPIPGILEFRDLLSQHKPADETWLPDCVRTDSGEWRCDNFIDANDSSDAGQAECAE